MPTQTDKQRESNLELFRIVTMLLIVAHHMVVNSGILAGGGPVRSDPRCFRSLFTIVLGAWGKTGINCFVLITGYFMCRSKITLKKFAKLFLEYMFYKIGIAAVLLCTGYRAFSLTDFFSELIPIPSIDTTFTPCFLIFFLCIPFLNMMTARMNERQHVLVMLLGIFTYTILGAFDAVTMNYVSWFIVLYFIASYIRIYPKPAFSNRKLLTAVFGASVLLSLLAVAAAVKFRGRYGINTYYHFVTDCNAPLALITAVCAFLFFKSLRVPQSRLINAIGGSTFGVLLLHSMNDSMRHLLWNDLFDVISAYALDRYCVFAIGAVLAVFAVCALIDMLRIRFLEKPLFARWDRMDPSPEEKLKKRFDRLCEKAGIGRS